MNNTMINKMKNSAFGKFLRRIVGEETGAVMMEYVIVAVLIAAACVVAVAVFGKAIRGQTEVATDAVIAETDKAITAQENNRTEANAGVDKARKAAEKFHGEAGKTDK